MSKLDDTECEKDLDFKEHKITQTNKAITIGMAGCIHKNIINKTSDIMVPLFKAMIRPIVDI